ncbi:hypothetical protein [Prevotella nigrescens]|uniref:hypothetical protein n=1 Tax=Prevotella nigrescens TaxID=28133 RepID=UPI0028D2FDD9|nr:hypothetical protein [Prevotella nigrescens]
MLQDRIGTPIGRVATQCLSSLRSYGNCRFGVTATVASGLRQQSLRGYDNRRFGVTTKAPLQQLF